LGRLRCFKGNTFVRTSTSIASTPSLPCWRRARANVFRRSVLKLGVYLNDGSRMDFIQPPHFLFLAHVGPVNLTSTASSPALRGPTTDLARRHATERNTVFPCTTCIAQLEAITVPRPFCLFIGLGTVGIRYLKQHSMHITRKSDMRMIPMLHLGDERRVSPHPLIRVDFLAMNLSGTTETFSCFVSTVSTLLITHDADRAYVAVARSRGEDVQRDEIRTRRRAR
jgi:hypothetical protein